MPGTKTAGSDRWVPIPAPLHALLSSVLNNDRQGPLVERWSNSRRDLAEACTRAGIDRVSSNDIRRTYASWLKNAGTDSAVVAQLLGHSSTRMVDLVYGKLHSSTLAQAVTALPDITGQGVRSKSVVTPLHLMRENHTDETTEPRPLASQTIGGTPTWDDCFVPGDRIELPTRGFSVLCSTD